MLSAEILAKIKALDLRGRYLATDMLAGDYASAFHGRGMEFHEVREYVPGDDVRGIDWNVTARMGQPFVKVFREERELTIMLMVDISASLLAGRIRSRREVASELAAILAWLANKSHDRVGLMLFGDSVELYVPPRKGHAHVWRIIRDVLTWPTSPRATDFSPAFDHLSKMLKRRAVCFLVSDFLAKPFPKSFRQIAEQHDFTCVQVACDVADGLIGDVPDSNCNIGVMSVFDRETGEVVEIDMSDSTMLRDIKRHHAEIMTALTKNAQSHGVGLLTVRTDQSVVEPLSEYLRGQR